MHDVAHAALPVAVALLVFTGAARAVLWSQVDDPYAQRLAREYVEPLSTWCLGALAVYAVALLLAGDLGVLSLGLTLILAAAAFALRSLPATPAESRAPAAARAERRTPSEPVTPATPA